MNPYFTFQWHITDSCDQRCVHCYIFSNNNNIKLYEMSLENMKEVLNSCIDMCEKIDRRPYFFITGGDPILHIDFWTLLQLFKDHNIRFGILGNPFHLTNEVCNRLKALGCDKYQLSIDGLKDRHDWFRMPGSFDTTLSKIDCINQAGLKSVVMTTVSKTNMHEIPEIIDIVVEHKVDIFAFGRYCPTSQDIEETHMTPKEYRALLEACWGKYVKYKDSGTSFNLKDHLWTLFLYEKGIFEIPEGLDEEVIYDGCHCADCHLTILPQGEVYACRRMKSRVGNVYTKSLYNIFTSDNLNKYREFDKFEKCIKCELFRFCRGCPAVAYGYTGNSYSADPQCWKEIDY